MKTNNILGIEEFKKKITNSSRLIGIDPGKKNIGIAITDDKRLIATPYKTIKKNKLYLFLKEINKIIEENNIKGIIIGNPINMDGSSGKSAQSAMDLAKNISTNVTIPISMWDERLSSEGAFSLIKGLNMNVSNKIKNLDKNSAAFILQGAIDFLSN